MTTGTIETARKDAVLTITIANEARRNAISMAMWSHLREAVAGADADIRAIVVRGAGDKAFVAGADISKFAAERNDPDAIRTYNQTVENALSAITDCPRPVIAMIQGYCIGGGMAIATACDLRLASEDAVFAIPAGKLGLAYSADGLERLQAICGPGLVREMMFTARRFDAAEMQRWNFLNRVVSQAALEALVDEYVAMIAGNAPLTLHAAKIASTEMVLPPSRRDPAKVETAVTACFGSEDYKEGQAAFAEKRKPQFRGR